MKVVALWRHQKSFPPLFACRHNITVRPTITDYLPYDIHKWFLQFFCQDACFEELREVKVDWLLEHHDIDESIQVIEIIIVSLCLRENGVSQRKYESVDILCFLQLVHALI